MAGGELDGLDATGKDPAFVSKNDLGRATAVERLRGERVVVHGVEDAVVASDRFDLDRPRLIAEAGAIPVGDRLDLGDVIT